jgi:AraC-like DNA-binding protein
MVAVVERLLRDRLLHHDGLDTAVLHAANWLRRGTRVVAVADRLGVSQPTLLRRFRREVGLTPKAYQRVWRLQRLIRHVGPRSDPDWAAAAVAHDYYDQSHLVHDFVQLTGIRPSDYRPRDPASLNHIPLRAG